MDQLETGDLILYNCKKGMVGRLIQFFTRSEYSHVGIVLKNPTFTEKPLVGMYFWESSDEHCLDSEDSEFKVGIEIVDLKKSINDAYKKESTNRLKGILAFSDEELVSSDFKFNPNSCIIDGLSTMVMEDNCVKVIGWYDNEWGYASRTADLVAFLDS